MLKCWRWKFLNVFRKIVCIYENKPQKDGLRRTEYEAHHVFVKIKTGKFCRASFSRFCEI